MRRVCYISGTRADFGLMKDVLQAIHSDNDLDIGVIVTGMHLLNQYGNTHEEITDSGLSIIGEVRVDLSGTSSGEMSTSLGKQLIGFTQILENNKPDIVLLLGDRGEMLAGAITSMHLNIPIVHIHGGELSGTIDEPVRHAISKLSHYHFTATENSRNRLIRMGELPNNIFVTGAPGLASIHKEKLLKKYSLFSDYGLDHEQSLLLVLFHPVVQQANIASEQMQILLQAVIESNMQSLVIMPNSDAGGSAITKVVNNFSADNQIKSAIHVPRQKFLSLMSYSDVMVGNSSSGIIESASVGTPFVNIGNRQAYRERNENIIDVTFNKDEILSAVIKAGQMKGHKWHNVYDKGNASKLIVKLLKNISLSSTVLEKINAY